MINTKMREYDYFTLEAQDEYGQRQLPAANSEPTGKIKMAIYTTSKAVQDNVNYLNSNYIGLTYSSLLDESCVIQYGEERLKVLYINSAASLKQVFLVAI